LAALNGMAFLWRMYEKIPVCREIAFPLFCGKFFPPLGWPFGLNASAGGSEPASRAKMKLEILRPQSICIGIVRLAIVATRVRKSGGKHYTSRTEGHHFW
jgi:hypothetical protein